MKDSWESKQNKMVSYQGGGGGWNQAAASYQYGENTHKNCQWVTPWSFKNLHLVTHMNAKISSFSSKKE